MLAQGLDALLLLHGDVGHGLLFRQLGVGGAQRVAVHLLGAPVGEAHPPTAKAPIDRAARPDFVVADLEGLLNLLVGDHNPLFPCVKKCPILCQKSSAKAH